MGVPDYVLLTIVALILILALRRVLRRRKSGACHGCSGCCDSCRERDCSGKDKPQS